MTYTPVVERTCHVIGTTRDVAVLPNERVFVVPDDE
jgi:hypothetical protein